MAAFFCHLIFIKLFDCYDMMIVMSKDKQNSSPEYRGPGRVTSAFGGYALNSLVYGTAGTVAGYVIGRGSVGSARLAGVVVGLPAAIYGAVRSWNAAGNAQHDQDKLVAENTALKNQLSWIERVSAAPAQEKSFNQFER